MTTLLQRSDRCQHCSVRAVQPPLVPPHAVESVAKIEGTIPLVRTQRADALELAIEKRLVTRQLAMIDLQHIHAAKQQAGIIRIVSPFRRFSVRRCFNNEFRHCRSPYQEDLLLNFLARFSQSPLIQIKTASLTALRLTYINARHLGRSSLASPNLKLLAFCRERENQMFALTQGRQNQSPLQSLLAWCRAWFNRSPESDLGCCGEAEIERMARDIRLSASELRAVARTGPKAADLLLRRMAALDLDPKEVAWLEPAAFRDLQRVCIMCKSHRRCASDFARKASLSAWERYCPNTSTLDALNAMPWRARQEW